MIKLFQQCPACGGPLVVTECRCADCNLQLRGEFRLGLFSNLSDDQLTFVRVFLRTRGNLTEVEKVLGVSYPTIRNKLDEINKALDRAQASAPSEHAEGENGSTVGSQTGAAGRDQARRAILEQVSSGKLTAAQAAEQLRGLQGGE